jgi:hypothetical protein
MDPPRPVPRRGAAAIGGRVLRAPLVALAVLAVLVDDAFRAVFLPAIRAVAGLQPIRRLEEGVARLPPYATLALFVLPLAIIEPLKIYALYLFSEGRWMAGCLTFVVAKVVGIGLAERLFAISRDKLLSIAWFAWCYRKVVGAKDWVHAWLLATRFWPAAVRFVRRVRESLARARLWVRDRVAGGRPRPGTLLGRFAAARRLVRWPNRP